MTAHDELECRVQERTAELAATNEELRAETGRRKQAEAAWQRDTATLTDFESSQDPDAIEAAMWRQDLKGRYWC